MEIHPAKTPTVTVTYKSARPPIPSGVGTSASFAEPGATPENPLSNADAKNEKLRSWTDVLRGKLKCLTNNQKDEFDEALASQFFDLVGKGVPVYVVPSSGGKAKNPRGRVGILCGNENMLTTFFEGWKAEKNIRDDPVLPDVSESKGADDYELDNALLDMGKKNSEDSTPKPAAAGKRKVNRLSTGGSAKGAKSKAVKEDRSQLKMENFTTSISKYTGKGGHVDKEELIDPDERENDPQKKMGAWGPSSSEDESDETKGKKKRARKSKTPAPRPRRPADSDDDERTNDRKALERDRPNGAQRKPSMEEEDDVVTVDSETDVDNDPVPAHRSTKLGQFGLHSMRQHDAWNKKLSQLSSAKRKPKGDADERRVSDDFDVYDALMRDASPEQPLIKKPRKGSDDQYESKNVNSGSRGRTSKPSADPVLSDTEFVESQDVRGGGGFFSNLSTGDM
ncbi:hypothetical protein HDU96_007711 [Phlyctochytrium bullatum]|nr:hypothetical protein HDU96_007711 [Phlyctochytrium bullatum]